MEVIVVDDASTDDTVQFLKRKFPKVRILTLKKNVGYDIANNEGYKIANGKYVVLVNNDVFIPKNWLKPLVETAERDKEVAIVSSMPFPPGVKLTDEKFGDKMNISPTCMGRSDPNIENPLTLFGCSTSCLVRKSAVKQPFDPAFIAMHEDVYMSWLAWLRGYKVLFERKSKIWHIGQVTYGHKLSKRYVYLVEKNRFFNIFLFLKGATILLLSPIIAVDFLFRLLYFLLSLRFDLFLMEFKAVFWNLSNYKLILKKRKHIQNQRKVKDYFILNLFCEDVYGSKNIVKKTLNLLFKAYFRLVKKITGVFGV